ncbi:MAG: class I tRNA ligase family protein, partial [Angelakisella sp.]
LIRDAQGRKMSKSLGNGIDPLEIIDMYGADTLRFTLATGNSPGNDMRFSDDKVKASRNFANKIWNASRFILMNLPEEITECKLPAHLETEDKWVVSLYNTLVREVTENMEKFELGIAVGKLYDFIWDILCDWYIELTKSRIQAGGETAMAAQQVLCYVTANTLKLLHPFMPFITEEIWQSLPHAGEGDSIMIAKWPEYDEALSFAKEEADFQKVMDMIRAIRNQRAEMNIPPSKKAHVYIETSEQKVFEDGAPFMLRLASASEVEVGTAFAVEGAVQVITSAARALIPMSELIDREKELARLGKERAKCESDIAFIRQKLDNAGFVAKAPARLVEEYNAKVAEHTDRLAKIDESIKALG